MIKEKIYNLCIYGDNIYIVSFECKTKVKNDDDNKKTLLSTIKQKINL